MTEPTPPRPQPVLDTARLGGLTSAAVVMVAGAVLIIQQGISVQNISAVGAAISGAVTAVAALVTYLVAVFHGKAAAAIVTPLSAPQNDAGVPLVPDPLAWRTDGLKAVESAGAHGAEALDVLRTAAEGARRENADLIQTTYDLITYDRSPFMGPQADQEPPNMQESYPPVPTNRPRLGRLPNRGRPRVKLTADLAPAGFTPPASVDWYSKVPPQSWGMDGNDAVGDCTCAEVDHAVKTLQVAAGNTEVQSNAQEVLNLYSAVTGYNPADPNTDQGAEMQAVRDYWRKNGARLGGTMHNILLFAEVDHTSHDLVKWCIARFGEVGVGINFPASAMDQFNAGQPWDVVKGSPIEGGHAIAAVGYDDRFVYVVTWGKVQPMTWAFWDAFTEEAWTQLDQEFLNSVSGDDPLAETAYQLGQQYEAVTGQANPFPAPAPNPQPDPGPAPAPSPAPTPGPSGFPLAAWSAFVKHPYSRLKEQAAIQAVNAWLNGK